MKFSSKTRSIAANSRNKSINSANIFKRIHPQLTTSRNRCHPRILRVNSKRHRYRIGPANKRTNLLCLEVIASRTPKEISHPPKNTGLLIIRRRRCTPAAIWNQINIRLLIGPLRLGKIWIRSHNHNRSNWLEAPAVALQNRCFINSLVTLFRAMVTRSLEAQWCLILIRVCTNRIIDINNNPNTKATKRKILPKRMNTRLLHRTTSSNL